MENNIIYAYDFFDTIVHRRCNPEEILYSWAKWVARLCRYEISAEEIYCARKNSEKNLKKNSEEPGYDELIIDLFHDLNVHQISIENFIESSFKCEIELEKKHIFVDELLIRQIKNQSINGNKIIIISDFYAGKDYIVQILDYLGITNLFDEIFISSDIGKRKSTGNLYKYVLDNLPAEPSQMIMTGDNKISDVEIPTSIGIKSVHRPYAQKQSIKHNDIKRQIKEYCFGDVAEYPLNAYAEECAYFISDLYVKLKKNGIATVLFCAREGQALKCMFDYYVNNILEDTSIQSEYLYISRKSAILPSLEALESETFQLISRQYDEIKVADFLRCLSFSDVDIKSVCSDAEVSVDDCIIISKPNDIFCKIKKSKNFIELYETRRKEQKEFLEEYLSGLGVDFNGGRVAIVDVGWKGTIQDALQKMLGDRVTVFGFYVGLRIGEYEGSIVDNKYGLLFSDYPNKNRNYNLLVRNNLFWERILSADHGPTVGYQRNLSGKIIPILKEDEKNMAVYNYMFKYQEAMIETCKKIFDIYLQTVLEPYEDYNLMIKNVLWRECVVYPQITYVEKKTWALFEDNFGTHSDNKNNLRRIIKKVSEHGPYGFNRQIYDIADRTHIEAIKSIAVVYCKFVYWLKSIAFVFD